MSEAYKFGISEDFWKSLNKLPVVVKGKTIDLWNRMRQNPWDQTFHPEKVKGAADDRIWSSRVDDCYRLLWAHIAAKQKAAHIILLWVDKHDEAYEKARRLRFALNDGMVSVIDTVETRVVSTTSPGERIFQPLGVGKLFMPFTDKELLETYGVPPEYLATLRRLDDLDDLERLEPLLPEDLFDRLLALATGELVLARVPDNRLHAGLEKYHGGDNLHLFVNSQEFQRALAGDWEDWMVFLAPFQRRLVYADYAGPARIKGVAGSGKTVVALHRVLHLARSLEGEGKILFLTFGNRLPGIVHHLLVKLAGPGAPELNRIVCMTIHQWCLRLLEDHGIRIRVAEQDERLNALRTGIQPAKRSAPNLKIWQRDEQFFLDEITYVIKGRGLGSLAEYAELERGGRGSSLSEGERRAVWEVYLGYQRLLEELGLSDYDDFILKALRLIEKAAPPLSYRAAVVDEIQDLNAATLKLIRAIVKPQSNDLFLVGDGLQKLYPGGYVLSKLGIDVTGRATILRRNYRNTQEILRTAYAMMQSIRYYDMEEENSAVPDPEYSPRHGELPVIKGFYSPEEEIRWVSEEMERLKKAHGLSDKDFAVLYRWRKPYQDLLQKTLGRPITEITKDPQTYFGPAVKCTTFDSAKGLEFKIVFLVGVTDATMVPKDDLTLEGTALEEYLLRERSRLFVAMTRARDLLYITYSRGQLSRFLAGIPKSFLVLK